MGAKNYSRGKRCTTSLHEDKFCIELLHRDPPPDVQADVRDDVRVRVYLAELLLGCRKSARCGAVRQASLRSLRTDSQFFQQIQKPLHGCNRFDAHQHRTREYLASINHVTTAIALLERLALERVSDCAAELRNKFEEHNVDCRVFSSLVEENITLPKETRPLFSLSMQTGSAQVVT